MNPLDFEFGFKTILSLVTAAFWFWVNSISARMKEGDKRLETLKDEMHKVKLDYATKQEARADTEKVMNALERLEGKMDKMSDKLDKKADK